MTKAKKFKLGPKQKKWIRALKSGKFKKAKGDLEKDGGYCCLGVANCVLKLGENVQEHSGLVDTYPELGLYGSLGEIETDNDYGYKFLRGTKEYDSLADMNDKNISHKKIAEFIETNPELVFTKSV